MNAVFPPNWLLKSRTAKHPTHYFASTVILNGLLLTVATPNPSCSIAPFGAGETPVFHVAISSYSPGCVQ